LFFFFLLGKIQPHFSAGMMGTIPIYWTNSHSYTIHHGQQATKRKGDRPINSTAGNKINNPDAMGSFRRLTSKKLATSFRRATAIPTCISL